MNLKPYYLRTVSISDDIHNAAENLVKKMKTNSLEMDVLPNTYENFSGRMELEDYLSFCEFLQSRRGKIVLNLTEEEV